MMTRKRATITARQILVLVPLLLFGCGPEFDDPTMAVVKKPELLSIVLEPPEAAPGERVRASFLMADERGAIELNTNVWLPMAGTGDLSEEELAEAIGQMDLDFDALGKEILEFQVPPESHFAFNEDGFAGQMLSLFAASVALPEPDKTALLSLSSLDELVERGLVEVGIRTLVVSKRSERNQNPVIVAIDAGDKHIQNTPLVLSLSEDVDPAVSRQYAADNPLVAEEGAHLVFKAIVTDDTTDSSSLRYQWISTGGDFAGVREKVQEFQAPKYRELQSGEVDQTGKAGGDPRIDPNLHPVWLIVRDDGEAGQLGQSWAEFYLRVVPVD